jgi:DeoR/GlpR family transcriptional regulator of sugar metabolism
MYKEERQRRIHSIIESRGKASVVELAGLLKTSSMTIRRDLQELADRGIIERTHGGAELVANYTPLQPHAFMLKTSKERGEKQFIGRAAANLIGPGEKIYLSAGTTAYWVANALLKRDDLTVVTNSLPNALLLAQNPNIEIIMVGGFLRRNELSLVGHFAETVVRQLHLDKAIMGIRGIHLEYGLTSDYPREMMNDRSFMNAIENVILVADHTKFGFVATSLTAPITAAKTIITSNKAPTDMLDAIRALGVEIILAADQ